VPRQTGGNVKSSELCAPTKDGNTKFYAAKWAPTITKLEPAQQVQITGHRIINFDSVHRYTNAAIIIFRGRRIVSRNQFQISAKGASKIQFSKQLGFSIKVIHD
jgi:hypothetical protein